MTILVRRAQEHDYEALSAVFAEVDSLHAEALPDLYRPVAGPARPPEHIAAILASEDAALFVAESARQIVGLIEVEEREGRTSPLHVPRRYAAVETVVVRAQARGQGIGRALMAAAERWARERGLASIELTVYEFNRPAMALYEHLGYSTLRRTMRKPIG